MRIPEKVKNMYDLWTAGNTLKEIGSVVNLSGERVRQLLYAHYGDLANRRFGGMSKKPKKVSSEQSVFFSRIKYNVKRKGKVEFTLTKDDIEWSDVCAVSGLPINWDAGKVCMDSPSLLRIDRTLGYVPGNVKLVRYEENLKKIWH